eukprot:2272810-Pyramimonas_sp.AAC.1
MACRSSPIMSSDFARSFSSCGVLLGPIVTTSRCSEVRGWQGNAARARALLSLARLDLILPSSLWTTNRSERS